MIDKNIRNELLTILKKVIDCDCVQKRFYSIEEDPSESLQQCRTCMMQGFEWFAPDICYKIFTLFSEFKQVNNKTFEDFIEEKRKYQKQCLEEKSNWIRTIQHSFPTEMTGITGINTIATGEQTITNTDIHPDDMAYFQTQTVNNWQERFHASTRARAQTVAPRNNNENQNER